MKYIFPLTILVMGGGGYYALQDMPKPRETAEKVVAKKQLDERAKPPVVSEVAKQEANHKDFAASTTSEGKIDFSDIDESGLFEDAPSDDDFKIPIQASPAKESPVFVKELSVKRGMDSELRDAFLLGARKDLRRELLEKRVRIASDLQKWIDSDEQARMAIYGTVSPVDADILINLNQLWKELGPSFVKKYKHMCLGMAVARRGLGMDELHNFSKWGFLISSAEAAREKGKDPAEVLALPHKDKLKDILPQSSSDKRAYKAVEFWMRQKKLSHRQVIETTELRGEVRAILKKYNSKIKDVNCLKGLLVLQKKRPGERTPTMKVSEYLKFLVKIHKTPASQLNLEEGQRWPYFPTTTAPWPMLLPIARSMPRDEAQYIWEKFQGKHGKKRVHTYGPYRKNMAAVAPQYDAMKWHWQAWPAVIHQGGVCGTMSTIAAGTMTALGRPALKAGQPGHSCIVGYNVTADGQFFGYVGQSVTAGPDGTGTGWLFRDGSTWKCGGKGANAVHHMGLALAMNPGITSYMDTRIALHIYKGMDGSERQKEGRQLLMSALQANPFNTELWYTLSRDAKTFAQLESILNDIDRFMASSAEVEEAATDGDASAAITNAEAEDNFVPDSLEKNVATYRRLIKSCIMENAFASAAKFSRSDREEIYAFLNTRRHESKQMHLAADRFFAACKGDEAFRVSLNAEIEGFMNNPPHGRKAKGRAQGLLRERLRQAGVMGEREAREKWLQGMLEAFPENQAVYVIKKTGKKKFHPFYEDLLNSLINSYRKSPRNKEGFKKMIQLKKKLLS